MWPMERKRETNSQTEKQSHDERVNQKAERDAVFLSIRQKETEEREKET